jgi:hypothetical protein
MGPTYRASSHLSNCHKALDVGALIEYLSLMSKTEMISAYTDYPIHNIYDDINDTDPVLAPIRKITILTYDRDKYCDVLVFFTDTDGDPRAMVTEIKAGYCYKNEARLDEAVLFSHDELIALPWKY